MVKLSKTPGPASASMRRPPDLHDRSVTCPNPYVCASKYVAQLQRHDWEPPILATRFYLFRASGNRAGIPRDSRSRRIDVWTLGAPDFEAMTAAVCPGDDVIA